MLTKQNILIFSIVLVVLVWIGYLYSQKVKADKNAAIVNQFNNLSAGVSGSTYTPEKQPVQNTNDWTQYFSFLG